MGIFGQKPEEKVLEQQNTVRMALVEAEIIHVLTSDADIKAFIESGECESLEEAGLIGKHTIVRLNKMDDLSRRTKMAALQLAKDSGDPLFDKLVANRVKEREYIAQIMRRHKMNAEKEAKTAQRDYFKNIPILKKMQSSLGK